MAVTLRGGDLTWRECHFVDFSNVRRPEVTGGWVFLVFVGCTVVGKVDFVCQGLWDCFFRVTPTESKGTHHAVVRRSTSLNRQGSGRTVPGDDEVLNGR